MILKGNHYARQPFPHFTKLDRNLHSGLRRANLRNLAPVVIEQSECARDGSLQFVRQRQPPNQKSGCSRRDREPKKSYSPDTTHTLEGERPEKRLSYIGTTCVAGQRKVPAAVARANTE